MKNANATTARRRGATICAVTLLAAALGLAGCSGTPQTCKAPPPPPKPPPKDDYVRVDLAVDASTATNDPAKVTTTKLYTSANGQSRYKTVMVRPPDKCVDASVTEQEGRGKERQRVMGITCAVYITELEQALSARGYSVISWDSSRGKNAHQEARKAGADLLVLINSLETPPPQKLDFEAEAVIGYFASDNWGLRGAPLPLSRQRRRFVNAFVLDRSKNASRLMRKTHPSTMAVTLDVTLVDTTTSQSVWFYRRTLKKRIHLGDVQRSYLFRTRGEYMWPVRPKRVAVPRRQHADDYATGSRGVVKRKVGPSLDELRLAQMRLLVKDFANRMQKGE